LGGWTGAGVETFTEHRVIEIKDTNVIGVDKDGNEYSLEADKIVVALGATPGREPADNLDGVVSQIYIIGDAAEPRDIAAAIYEGALIARQV